MTGNMMSHLGLLLLTAGWYQMVVLLQEWWYLLVVQLWTQLVQLLAPVVHLLPQVVHLQVVHLLSQVEQLLHSVVLKVLPLSSNAMYTLASNVAPWHTNSLFYSQRLYWLLKPWRSKDAALGLHHCRNL